MVAGCLANRRNNAKGRSMFCTNYTANKIPLPSAGKFSDQSGPPKQRIIIEGIAPISAKPINLGLGVMPLMFRFHPM